MKSRPAQVAGQFYPSDPEILRSTVEQYIDQARLPDGGETPAAVITPHAGYVFSGATAGHAYARIQPLSPKRILLLGVSHRYSFQGISLYPGDSFETPLGKMPIDRKANELLADRFPGKDALPHFVEHTLETQLPFLQVIFGEIPFVPVLFGTRAGSFHEEFGKAISELLDPDDLLVASTDLSHFLSEPDANSLDQCTISWVLSGDTWGLIERLEEEECSMCGAAAVVAAMAFAEARGAVHRRLLDYRTSARVSGDYDRVVGYAAISLEKEERKP